MPKRKLLTYVGSLRKRLSAGRQGFTLIELLIVIAIIILLLIFVLINFQSQIAKANDAKRKSDLYVLHTAIEEYFNDHGVFPPQGKMSDCGGSDMTPYLKEIPCDPLNQSQYGYFLSPSTGGYRICATLADTTDPAIAAIGCNGDARCGLPGPYNYCLATGTTPSAVGTPDEGIHSGEFPTTTPGNGSPTLTPILSPTPILYACTRDGLCNRYDGSGTHGCHIWWPNDCPQGACAVEANRCSD